MHVLEIFWKTYIFVCRSMSGATTPKVLTDVFRIVEKSRVERESSIKVRIHVCTAFFLYFYSSNAQTHTESHASCITDEILSLLIHTYVELHDYHA